MANFDEIVSIEERLITILMKHIIPLTCSHKFPFRDIRDIYVFSPYLFWRVLEPTFMSNWQSFFNQLVKPVNTGNRSCSTTICQCTKGSLSFHQTVAGNNPYIPQNGCSLGAVCCAIQVDKHRAHMYSKTLPFVESSEKIEVTIIEKQPSRIRSIDDLIRR